MYQAEKLIELTLKLLRSDPSLTAEAVSTQLQVHRHTLRRALKAQGKSFASVKRGLVLERFGRGLAGDQVVSFKQIWAELGFSSASAFARYIRRTTGKSPTELREEMGSRPISA